MSFTDVVSALVTLLGVYLALGLLFGIAFVWRGVGRVDPAAAKGTIGFRILILPGVTVFWPMLLLRWLRGVSEPPPECTAHRRLAERLEQESSS